MPAVGLDGARGEFELTTAGKAEEHPVVPVVVGEAAARLQTEKIPVVGGRSGEITRRVGHPRTDPRRRTRRADSINGHPRLPGLTGALALLDEERSGDHHRWSSRIPGNRQDSSAEPIRVAPDESAWSRGSCRSAR